MQCCLRPINNFAGSRLLHPTGGVQSGLGGLPDLTKLSDVQIVLLQIRRVTGQ